MHAGSLFIKSIHGLFHFLGKHTIVYFCCFFFYYFYSSVKFHLFLYLYPVEKQMISIQQKSTFQRLKVIRTLTSFVSKQWSYSNFLVLKRLHNLNFLNHLKIRFTILLVTSSLISELNKSFDSCLISICKRVTF